MATRGELDADLGGHIAAVSGVVQSSFETIVEIANRLSASFRHGGKLLVCGNGGSAGDAQHLAAEFVNHLKFDRPALPAIALTTDTSIVTSIANDRRFEEIFGRQIEAIGSNGDMLIAISTSGSSANVIEAVRAGRRRGLVTVGFTGLGGAVVMKQECDLVLVVPSRDTQRIQEAHLFVFHVIAGMVEEELFGNLTSENTEKPR